MPPLFFKETCHKSNTQKIFALCAQSSGYYPKRQELRFAPNANYLVLHFSKTCPKLVFVAHSSIITTRHMTIFCTCFVDNAFQCIEVMCDGSNDSTCSVDKLKTKKNSHRCPPAFFSLFLSLFLRAAPRQERLKWAFLLVKKSPNRVELVSPILRMHFKLCVVVVELILSRTLCCQIGAW